MGDADDIDPDELAAALADAEQDEPDAPASDADSDEPGGGKARTDRELEKRAVLLAANERLLREAEEDPGEGPVDDWGMDEAAVGLSRREEASRSAVEQMEAEAEENRLWDQLADIMACKRAFPALYPSVPLDLDVQALTPEAMRRIVRFAKREQASRSTVEDRATGMRVTMSALEVLAGYGEGLAPRWGYRAEGFAREFTYKLEGNPGPVLRLTERWLPYVQARMGNGFAGDMMALAMAAQSALKETDRANRARGPPPPPPPQPQPEPQPAGEPKADVSWFTPDMARDMMEPAGSVQYHAPSDDPEPTGE